MVDSSGQMSTFLSCFGPGECKGGGFMYANGHIPS